MDTKTDVAFIGKKPDFNIEKFKALIESIKKADKKERIKHIQLLLDYEPLFNHHTSKELKVLSECDTLEYAHESHTSKKLLKVGYHVVFVPKGYFKRSDKKFDVFLFKGHLLFEADLKCINSSNTDTIGNRIKEGSEQAKRVILDIQSTITKHKLIEALRTGCVRNDNIVEIFLFYGSVFYTLQKNQILSNNIFSLIK